MDIEALVETMAKEIDSGNFKLQVVFDRNIVTIENLKNQGVISRRLNELINEKIKGSISDTYFLNLVFRANKKVNKINVNQVNVVEKETEISKKGENLELETIDEWRNNARTNAKLTERQIKNLKKLKISIDDFNRLELASTSQINQYLAQKNSRKYEV